MKIGSLVECIRDCKPYNDLGVFKSGVYTVRAVGTNLNGTRGILLNEIAPVYGPTGMENSFAYSDFIELLPPIENVEQWVNENTHELQPTSEHLYDSYNYFGAMDKLFKDKS